MSLKRKTFAGLFWNSVNNVSLTTISLIITTILARILSPKAFGLMGMVEMVIAFISKINEFGLSPAIIQGDDMNQKKLSSLFYFNIIIGLLMFIVVYLSAGIVALFFVQDDLTPLLHLISIVFLIVSFGLIQKSMLKKEMEFKKIFKVETMGTVIYGVSAIILAVNNYGAKSLVIGYIIKIVIQTILFHYYYRWYPSFQFDFKEIKDLLSFGTYLMGSSFLSYFNENIDYLIIGKYLGADALGYYTIAFKIITIPMKKIGWIINKTFLPAFSKLKNQKFKLKEYYFKVLEVISLITFPMMMGIAIIAREFVIYIYGEHWAQTIIIIQILSVAGAVKSLSTTVGTVFFSQGRADITFKWNVFAILNLALFMILGMRWGLLGVTSSVTLFNIYIFPLIMMICGKVIDISLIEILKVIKNSLIYTLTMGGLLILIKKNIIYFLNMQYQMLIIIVLGVIIYCGVALLLQGKYYVKQFYKLKDFF